MYVGILITDYDWAETHRPIVTIEENFRSVHVQIGNGPGVHPVTFELTATNRDDLHNQLKGWSEIFAKAAEVVEAKVLH
jgi:hypothetical protein